MADSKKYDGSQWEHSLRKLTTATADIEPTIYTDGTAITAYTIKGNTVQSGTPTPSAPISVNGVGDKTANLCKVSQDNSIYYSNYDNYNVTNNVVTTSGNALFGFKVKVDSSKQYSVGIIANKNIQLRIREYSNEPTDWTTNFVVQSVSIPTLANTRTTASFTTDSQTNYVLVVLYADVSYAPCTISDIILNEGSTALPYEPYGYKIPISSGQQTIVIYIGDLPLLKSLDGTAVDEISNGILTRRVDSDGSVLPTPITTQITMPSIPTTEGANSISVDTTVQPSEFSATWTGWHDASVKEKSENLFDKDNTTIENGYLYDTGTSFSWTSASDSRSVRIACETNTQYTLSVTTVLPIFRIGLSDDSNPSPRGITCTKVVNGSNINQYTFTTGASDKYIIFQGTGSMVDTWIRELMLVEGSTAPSQYEPYWK